MACADISEDKLFIGSIVTIFSRQLKLVDYGDTFTRNHFASNKETTFGLIKPDVYVHTGKIIDSIYQNGFTISRLRMGKFGPSTTQRFLQISNQQNGEASQLLQSDVSTGIEIVGKNAVAEWQRVAEQIRQKFGTTQVRNAVHATANGQTRAQESSLFFGSDFSTTAFFKNCTCAVIKPHAIAAGHAGQIIDAILEEGFEISAMEMFNLDKPTAEEFLEIYRGVLPEYIPTTEQMTTGPCIVLEVRQENAVTSFRELCGPMDSEIAKSLRPNSLRARFGVDRVRNAIHCTDLPEDGVLECEYFFKIQQ